ncbi:MAG: phosphatidylglycerophosphatase A [Nitrospirota bacterium]
MRLLRNGIIFIATVGYIGYFPVAPGTAGSLIGFLIFWIADLTPLTLSVIILLLFPLGVYVSDKTEKIFEKSDPPEIVLDEVVGTFISVFLLPKKIEYIIPAFFLFRFFDIVKPYPIRKIDETVKGGFGVMLDDVVAAVYTNLTLHSVRFFYEGR